MAEPTAFMFPLKEVTELLVRHVGAKEGVWTLQIRFGFGAANIGDSDDTLKPTALIPVMEIGIQKGEKVNSLSVDAAKIAARPSRKTSV
jgi:hypothetical protein